MRLLALAPVAGLALILGSCGGPTLDGRYFPITPAGLDVVHSEVQVFVVDTVLTGLVRPYGMAFLPDGAVLVTERRGHLLVLRKGRIEATLQGGNVPTELRDITLHPRYEENGWIYFSHYVDPTSEEPARTVVVRARLEGDRLVDDEVVYSAGPFRSDGNWYGSRIAFDREGYLYVTVGGRAMWGAPPDRDRVAARIDAQDLTIPGGKTMRLFDDGRVPPDNPFLDTPGALPEIFTYGHRQHQGLVLHPWTGELWSTEHGEMGGSELNVLRSGGNYGWPLATFSLNYDTTHIAAPYGEGLEAPFHHWTPSIAPSGLDFVTSDLYPAWKGNVLVASLVQQLLVRGVIEDGRFLHDERLLEGIGRVRTVKVAPDGLIYVLSEDPGVLVRLLPAR
jgi:aldose sugar dehydrogenase